MDSTGSKFSTKLSPVQNFIVMYNGTAQILMLKS
jgi:hypothetical protein